MTNKLLIKVELIDHVDQRYPTAGDWQYDQDGVLCVRVSNTGIELDSILVGIHEVVEAVLCKVHGVREADVDAFDSTFAGDGEPGEDPLAPYRNEHAVADVVERAVAQAAGVPWAEYNDRVEGLFVKEDR
jgi:hypothetical protein